MTGPRRRTDPIIVVVRRTPSDMPAARYALELAGRPKRPVVLLSTYAAAAFGDDETDRARQTAYAAARSVATRLRPAPTLRVEVRAEEGHVVDVLHRLGSGASAIVLGRDHVDLTDHIFTTGAISDMISGLACPVVVVPYDWSLTPAGRLPVLVALDTETDARELVRFAFAEAARRQTAVVALHLLDSPPSPSTTVQHRARLAEIITSARRAHPGLLSASGFWLVVLTRRSSVSQPEWVWWCWAGRTIGAAGPGAGRSRSPWSTGCGARSWCFRVRS